MKYLVSIVIIIFFVSCEKEANIKLPETKPLPVIYCYISPTDSFIRLKLTLSQPIFGTINDNLGEPVNNANVSISSSQGNAVLIYNQTGYYEIKTSVYPVVQGETYKVAVTLANGDYAEAETTVPVNVVPVLNASYEKIANNYQSFNRLKASFLDDPASANYYCLMSGSVYSFTTGGFSNPGNEKKLFTDQNRNGETIEGITDAYDNSQSVIGYDLFLLNCNYHYFTFYKSIENYQEGNPFAEPSLVYSNVKGGLGVFAAYTLYTYRLNL